MIVAASTRSWLALSLVPGLDGDGARRLLRQFGSPEAIFSSSSRSLKTIVMPDVANEISKGIPDQVVSPALKWLEQDNNHLITLADVEYPRALLNITDPPLLLYVKGRCELLNRPALAIVGSRNATPEGIINAKAFAKSLSNAGFCIISGMARGIESAAHFGALKGQGSSIAVIGTGIDRVYPADNRELAHELAQHGALLSEFPLGTPPLPAHFPKRNRLISGMSLGCLVVEASLQSGSQITARHALEQGREVFAIPGSIHSPQSKGCHALLKQGAKLVETASDILEELDRIHTPETLADDLSAKVLPLLEHLGSEPVGLDSLGKLSGLTLNMLSSMLLKLEQEGRVRFLPGGLYQRIH